MKPIREPASSRLRLRRLKEARDRLTDRKLDKWADHLPSLRITGKERLWGFLRAGVFHALWWDPEHEVYPSKKKHT